MEEFKCVGTTKPEIYNGFGTRICIPKQLAISKSQEYIPILHDTNATHATTLYNNIPKPIFSKTNLISLPNLAKFIGLKNIYIKDESTRFGLNSFKGLGGSVAVYKQVLNKFGFEKTMKLLRKEEKMQENEKITFMAATDGNHGRGVAFAALKLFDQKCHIFMPKNTLQFRVDIIRSFGAEVTVTDIDYDETVLLAAKLASDPLNKTILISDTAVPGDESIPCDVMAGYLTLFKEIVDDINEKNMDFPTHVSLQAGVGGLAGAGAAFWVKPSNHINKDTPRMICVEPLDADCFLQSASHGRMTMSPGHSASIMNGLNCLTCSTVAYDILSETVSGYVGIGDEWAREAVRILNKPLPGDPAIVAGESGGSGLAGILALCLSPDLSKSKQQLNLDNNSVVSIISTEGHTDPELVKQLLEQESFIHKVYNSKQK